MTLQDLTQSPTGPTSFMTKLQGSADYLTPVLRFLQEQGQPPTLGQGPLSSLTPSDALKKPATTNTSVSPLSNQGLISNGKLVESWLTSQKLIGGLQTYRGTR